MATLGENETSMVYLSLVNGRFAQRVKPDVEKAEKRTLKNGRVVYERYYNHAAGVITNLELRSNEYEGKTFESMLITLDDEVQIQLSGGIDNYQNKDIVNTLLSPGCDITKKMVFIAKRDDEGYSRVFILQDTKGIKRYSNKENPRDVPRPVEREKLGKKVWDWTEQDEWYFDKFQELSEKVQENVPHKELDASVAKQQSTTSDQETTVEEVEEEVEDKKTKDPLDDFPDKEPEPTEEDLKKKGDEEVNPEDIPF